MDTIEADYLVVGAGAAGASFVDALIAASSAEVVLVDRLPQPGGHWLHAYPFVRLHQPSLYYGVPSMALGQDRIQQHGPEAGFYERASGAEVCDYYRRVLDERFIPSGQVRFLGETDYAGEDADGHVVVSRLTGRPTRVVVRRTFVDATYVEAAIPATHQRAFSVADDVSIVTPTQLVDTVGGPGGFTVLGAGKTAMDVCVWLVEQDVDPDAIRWVRPRDGWLMDRTYTQPLDLCGSMMEFQSRLVEAAAHATSGLDLARRLEACGLMCRIDPAVDGEVYRGATISRYELEVLRSIERVVRLGRVEAIEHDGIRFVGDEIDLPTGSIVVDCTAGGLSDAPARPIFAPGRVVVQFTTTGVAPWSAALLGFVASLDLPVEEKNRICRPLPRTGTLAGQLRIYADGFELENIRRGIPEIASWNAQCRLNPGRTIADHLDDPAVQAGMARMFEFAEPAVANLARLLGGSVPR